MIMKLLEGYWMSVCVNANSIDCMVKPQCNKVCKTSLVHALHCIVY